jgi:antitoxin component YwqK of YwqJK toxin-antitoxin module
MKNTILILISLLVFTGVIEGKEVTYLQDRNGIKYEVNSEVGYTGKYVEWWSNGQKEYEGNFKDGIEGGFSTSWYENGQKRYEGNYKDGELDGLWTSWYENGQKRYEENWKDGKLDGHTKWDEDGEIVFTLSGMKTEK